MSKHNRGITQLQRDWLSFHIPTCSIDSWLRMTFHWHQAIKHNIVNGVRIWTGFCKLTPWISCCSLHFSTSCGCLKLLWHLLPPNAIVYMVSPAGWAHLIFLRSRIKYLSTTFLLHQHVTHFLILLETAKMHRPTSLMVTGILTNLGPCRVPILRHSPSKMGPSAQVIWILH